MTQLKNDLLLRTLRGQQTERTPLWMMRQAGRYLPDYMKLKEKYSFFQRCQTPELATEITIQPVEQVSQGNEQIAGEQAAFAIARGEVAGAGVQAHAQAGGLPRGAALRQQGGDDAGQQVAGAARRHARVTPGTDG